MRKYDPSTHYPIPNAQLSRAHLDPSRASSLEKRSSGFGTDLFHSCAGNNNYLPPRSSVLWPPTKRLRYLRRQALKTQVRPRQLLLAGRKWSAIEARYSPEQSRVIDERTEQPGCLNRTSVSRARFMVARTFQIVKANTRMEGRRENLSCRRTSNEKSNCDRP